MTILSSPTTRGSTTSSTTIKPKLCSKQYKAFLQENYANTLAPLNNPTDPIQQALYVLKKIDQRGYFVINSQSVDYTEYIDDINNIKKEDSCI